VAAAEEALAVAKAAAAAMEVARRAEVEG
jgi:hypothetical protein